MNKTEARQWTEANTLAAENHATEVEDQLRMIKSSILHQLAHMYRLKATGKAGASIPTEIKMEITIRLTPPTK